MSWNNRKETRIFEAKQKKLRQYYLDNGMTQEQINAMLAYDKAKCLPNCLLFPLPLQRNLWTRQLLNRAQA